MRTPSCFSVALPTGSLPVRILLFRNEHSRPFVNPKTFSRFQQNPSLSANGAVVAFLSTADLAGNNNDDAGHGNGEIYVADFSGSAVSNFRQLTKTKEISTGANATINVLSPGRRLSRDGAYVAYESRAVDPTANNTTNAVFLSVFVSRVSDGTAKIVGKRPPEMCYMHW